MRKVVLLTVVLCVLMALTGCRKKSSILKVDLVNWTQSAANEVTVTVRASNLGSTDFASFTVNFLIAYSGGTSSSVSYTFNEELSSGESKQLTATLNVWGTVDKVEIGTFYATPK